MQVIGQIFMGVLSMAWAALAIIGGISILSDDPTQADHAQAVGLPGVVCMQHFGTSTANCVTATGYEFTVVISKEYQHAESTWGSAARNF